MFMIPLDINDPSNSISGQYWQLDSGGAISDKIKWGRVAKSIKQGLPDREEKSFRETQPVSTTQFWGCLRDSESFWMYRIFITGRDNKDRPGRYFFVLFQLSLPSLLLNPEAARILSFLETERSIPLDLHSIQSPLPESNSTPTLTDSLFSGEKDSSPCANVAKCAKDVPVGSHYGWVFEDGILVRSYTDLPFDFEISDVPPTPTKTEKDPQRPTTPNRPPLSPPTNKIPTSATPTQYPPISKTINRKYSLILWNAYYFIAGAVVGILICFICCKFFHEKDIWPFNSKLKPSPDFHVLPDSTPSKASPNPRSTSTQKSAPNKHKTPSPSTFEDSPNPDSENPTQE